MTGSRFALLEPGREGTRLVLDPIGAALATRHEPVAGSNDLAALFDDEGFVTAFVLAGVVGSHTGPVRSVAAGSGWVVHSWHGSTGARREARAERSTVLRDGDTVVGVAQHLATAPMRPALMAWIHEGRTASYVDYLRLPHVAGLVEQLARRVRRHDLVAEFDAALAGPAGSGALLLRFAEQVGSVASADDASEDPQLAAALAALSEACEMAGLTQG